MNYFEQLEQSLSALRAHYDKCAQETKLIRVNLATASARASACAKTIAMMQSEFKAGVPIDADTIINAYRDNVYAHRNEEHIRAELEHAQSLEHEALDNLKAAAANLLSEIEAMVRIEMLSVDPGPNASRPNNKTP